jgi:hypothetical protein
MQISIRTSKSIGMNESPIFRCCVCHGIIRNPTWSMDHNTQKYGTDMREGQVCQTIRITSSQEMFRYDSQNCWLVHEPAIAQELKLKTTYPPATPMTLCCRCGAPVNRTQPHVSYAIMAMSLQDAPEGWIADVLSDKEFAVLCPECEEPDEAEATAEFQEQVERTRA